MKQLSLWFALVSCTVLVSLISESCKKELAPGSPDISKSSSAVAKNQPPPPPSANPAIAYRYRSDLKVMNADGSNQTTIVSGGGPGVWSPDGKRLLFQHPGGLSLVDVSVVNGKPTGS